MPLHPYSGEAFCKMKTRLVIFDLDGTLLNTIADLGEAVNHALSLMALPLHSLEQYRTMVGHGVRNLCVSALSASLGGEPTTQQVEECLSQFLSYYTAHIDVHTRPYPGMRELLERLNADGLSLAVASNKFQAGAEALVEEFFPGIPFVAVLGNSPDFPLKPDAALVEYIRGKAGASRDETLFVGDSSTDILTARNGGVKCIAVSWGFRPVEELKSADLIASSPQDILSAIDL